MFWGFGFRGVSVFCWEVLACRFFWVLQSKVWGGSIGLWDRILEGFGRVWSEMNLRGCRTVEALKLETQ